MSDQSIKRAANAKTGIVSPTRLAHVVMRTSNYKEMLEWYSLVFNAETAFANDEIGFLAYDDEHHRIAFVSVPELASQPDGIVGVHHVAFTYDNLSELLGNYERLRDRGIKPIWCVNHGPTTSMYYEDPDRNQLEFQVDNFETVEESGKFFYTEAFATNTIGVDFDPEEMIGRLASGESEDSIRARPASGPRGVDTIPIR
jgi:catechol-2,3-dioxygenase